MVLTVSDDCSWGLWDAKTTDVRRKIAIDNKPNWIESLPRNKIVVCDISAEVSLFEIKG